MSEEKTTLESFQCLASGLAYIAEYIGSLNKSIRRDEAEIAKLNSVIDELRDENERLRKGGEA